jgi:hypothetical protein
MIDGPLIAMGLVCLVVMGLALWFVTRQDPPGPQ